MKTFNISAARENLNKRKEEAAKESERLFIKASADSSSIIKMIIERFNPQRIYQWGSLLEKEMFTDYSDIDIALEGMDSIEDVLELERVAEKMTGFSLDIVELEKMPSAFSDKIRSGGILVYERN